MNDDQADADMEKGRAEQLSKLKAPAFSEHRHRKLIRAARGRGCDP